MAPKIFSLKRPVFEWVAYVTVISLIFIFVAGTHVVNALLNDTTGLCFFILMIFFGALLKSCFDVVYVNDQLKLSSRQVEDLWDIKEIRKFVRTSADSIFRNHIKNLYRIYKSDTEIRQDTLIELMEDNLNRRVRFVDVASSVLVTLGLVGTIIGLIGSVSGISSVVKSVGGDTSKLLSGMNMTISSMGTAFYSSLMGAVLGGVLLRILNNVVDNSINTLVNQISELTEVYVLPKLRKSARERDEEKSKICL